MTEFGGASSEPFGSFKRRSKMHCHKCDVPLDGKKVHFLGFEDEDFPLCSKCGEMFKREHKKAKSNKAKNAVVFKWLKELSDS